MSFFDSEIVQEEMNEIRALQEKVYSNIFTFTNMDNKDKLYHVNALEKLLDKQQVLYARLSLSDDPQAKSMKDDIMKSASMFGVAEGSDLGLVFSTMKTQINHMRKALDES